MKLPEVPAETPYKRFVRHVLSAPKIDVCGGEEQPPKKRRKTAAIVGSIAVLLLLGAAKPHTLRGTLVVKTYQDPLNIALDQCAMAEGMHRSGREDRDVCRAAQDQGLADISPDRPSL